MNKILSEFYKWKLEHDEGYQLDMVWEFLSEFSRGEILELLEESFANLGPAKVAREIEDLVETYYVPDDPAHLDENLSELGYDVASKLGYL